MSGRTDVLVAKDLAVAYGSTPVLTGVDLTVRAGDGPVGLIGTSGAGKSSVVHALLGEVPPSLGSVTFNGRTVAKLSRRDKRTMAVAVRCVHQGHGVEADTRRTVGQNVDAALKQARRAGRETGQDAATLFDLVGLDPATASRFPHQVSGGQRQRLAIAIAMASGPSVLLLDEPATALDEASTTEVLGRVFELAAQRGIGVLLVSHDLAMVDRLCPSVHVLAEGKILASGPLRELLTDPELPALRELAEALPFTVQPTHRVVAAADRIG